MTRLLTLAVFVFLAGCEATAIKDASKIRTSIALNENITTPVDVPVAYYIDKSKPEKNSVNFHKKLDEAIGLIDDDFFKSNKQLTNSSKFKYLFKLKTFSTWNQTWGNWINNLEMEVVDNTGNTLFKRSVKKQVGGGGLYDFDAVFNGLAAAYKELTIDFLNRQGHDQLLAVAANFDPDTNSTKHVREFIEPEKPSGSGSGFFIDDKGTVATAAHVVDECLFVEIVHKGEKKLATVKEASTLLDLAVLDTEFGSQKYASILSTYENKLGKPVFVTGYPLLGILSDSPSLTIGNVSSLGALKGSQGAFRFTAPVQPGNSGGAIVDYNGNLVGVVSSTLNQSVMLREAGATTQNVNFGVDSGLVTKFFNKNKISYSAKSSSEGFEQASADAVEYSNQVLCYR